jgi:hypothetical protein
LAGISVGKPRNSPETLGKKNSEMQMMETPEIKKRSEKPNGKNKKVNFTKKVNIKNRKSKK